MPQKWRADWIIAAIFLTAGIGYALAQSIGNGTRPNTGAVAIGNGQNLITATPVAIPPYVPTPTPPPPTPPPTPPPPPPAPGAPSNQTPLQADSVVDEIGVNVHYSYSDTANKFTTAASPAPNGQNILKLIKTIGIRHVRSGIADTENGSGPTATVNTTKCANVFQASSAAPYNFDYELVTQVGDGTSNETQPNEIQNAATCFGSYANHIVALEGGNERGSGNNCNGLYPSPAPSNTPYVGTFTGNNPVNSECIPELMNEQRIMYQAVHGTSPVLPSTTQLWQGAFANSGCEDHADEANYTDPFGQNLSSYIDYTTSHGYLSGTAPDARDVSPFSNPCGPGTSYATVLYHNYGTFGYFHDATMAAAPTKPVTMSETGYNAQCCGNSDGTVDPITLVRWDLREILMAHAVGMYRLMFYELASDSESYGFTDQFLNPKPVFYAIENFTTIMADPGASFSPTPFSYAFAANSDVLHNFYQKRDGSNWVVAWQNDDDFNNTTGTASPPTSTTATLSFGAIPSAITQYIFNPTNGTVSRVSITPALTISVPVTDTPSIIQIGTSTVPTLATPAPVVTPVTVQRTQRVVCTTASAAVNCVLPSPPAINDTLVVTSMGNVNAGSPPNSGFTNDGGYNGANDDIEVAHRTVQPGDPATWTFTPASAASIDSQFILEDLKNAALPIVINAGGITQSGTNFPNTASVSVPDFAFFEADWGLRVTGTNAGAFNNDKVSQVANLDEGQFNDASSGNGSVFVEGTTYGAYGAGHQPTYENPGILNVVSGSQAQATWYVPAGLSTAPPTTAPDALAAAPVTTSMVMADSVPAGLGIVTNLMQNGSNASTTDYGFTTAMSYLCGPWYGQFHCVRHVKDGAYTGDGNSAHLADLNFMATGYGIDTLFSISPSDTDATITANNASHTFVSAVSDIDKFDALDFAIALTSTSNASGNHAFGVAPLAGTTYPITQSQVTIGEGPTQETAMVSSYTAGTPQVINLAANTASAHKGNVATTLTAAITARTPPPQAVPPTPPISTPLPIYPPTPVPTAGVSVDTPVRGNDFVDSIGVNVHTCFGNASGTQAGSSAYGNYSDNVDPNQTDAALETLGIKWVRDIAENYRGGGICNPNSRATNLYSYAGVKQDRVISGNEENGAFAGNPGTGSGTPASQSPNTGMIATMSTSLGSSLWMTEGANEPDGYTPTDPCPSQTALPNPNTGNAHFQSCWSIDTKNMNTSFAPVVHTHNDGGGNKLKYAGPSIEFGSNYTCQNVNTAQIWIGTTYCPTPGVVNLSVIPNQSSIFDYGNMHAYPSGLNPEWSGLAAYMAAENVYAAPDPIVITETGWGDNSHAAFGEQDTDAIITRYDERLMLESARVGIARTFLFQLADQSTSSGFDSFGLLTNSTPGTAGATLTPKPQYEGLRNLIRQALDPGATAFPVSPVQYKLTGDTSGNVHHLWIEKQNGTYELALWMAEQDYDPVNQVALSTDSEAINVSVWSPSFTAATISTYNDSGTFANSTPAVTTNNGVASITATVTHNPIIVRFSNGAFTVPGPLPTSTPFVTAAAISPGTPTPAAEPATSGVNAPASLSLQSVTGIAAGDYLTINCASVNAGAFANTEVVQVASTYTAATGSGTIPLTVAPLYSHASSENVVEGCIRRVPGNLWGALTDGTFELQRVEADTPFLTTTLTLANNANGDGFSTQYGGTPHTYTNFDIAAVNGACQFNCGGAWGDGTTGIGPASYACFLNSCVAGSWQANLSSAYTQAQGTVKPVWCTSCGWPVVPVGAAASTSGTNYGSSYQIPEDVGAVYAARGPLYLMQNGYSRVYTAQLTNDAAGACTTGLIYTTGCGGSAGYGIGSGTAPKASYYTLTDLISLLTDPGCATPGCSFTPDSLTWGWTALPATSHTTPAKFQGTDVSQVRSQRFEYSNGTVAIAYWYEATDYLPAQSTSCASTTSCYQWCGNPANSGPSANAYTCLSTTLYVQGASGWAGCENVDTDDNAKDYTFGHMIPTSNPAFTSGDLVALSIKPEVQVLYCTNTGFNPTVAGTPVPSPTPIAAIAAVTPEPIPANYPAATAVPMAFEVTPPVPPPVAPPPSLAQPCVASYNAGLNATVTASLANPVTPGDFLVAGTNAQNPSGQTITPPSGFTQRQIILASTHDQMQIYTESAITSAASFTFTLSVPNYATAWVCEIKNASPTLDGIATVTQNIETSLTVGPITPNSAGDLAFAFFGTNAGSVTYTGTSGWASAFNEGTAAHQAAYGESIALGNTIAPVSANMTQTTSAYGTGALVLVAQANANPGPGSVAISATAFSPASVNLTTNTSAAGSDWISLGESANEPNVNGFDHKVTGGSQLSNWSPVGNGEYVSGAENSPPYPSVSWSSGDGTPDSSNPGTTLYHPVVLGKGNGFVFTAPGTTNVSSQNTISAFVSGYCSTVTMQAFTADGSFVSQPASLNYDQSAVANGLFTVSYTTGNPGASLVAIQFTVTNDSICSGITGSVGFHYATLTESTPPVPPPVPPPPPAPPTTFPATVANVTDMTTLGGNNSSSEFFTGTATSPACASFNVDAASGYTFPTILRNIPNGSAVTVTGTATYNTSTDYANGCPSGGMIASNVTTTATPAPSPTPYLTVALPGANGSYPVNANLLPESQITIEASIECNQTSAGSSLVGFPGAYDIELGKCDGNPGAGDATSFHIYDITSRQQAPIATVMPLAFASGSTHFVAVTQDGATINFFDCPQPSGTCTEYTTPDKGNLAYNGTASYLGQASPNIRVLNGEMWDFKAYNTAENPATIQAHANVSRSDPYGSAAPPPPPPPQTTYPVYSTYFSSSSPYRMTQAQLANLCATGNYTACGEDTNEKTLAQNWWNQGFYYATPSAGAPIYVTPSGDTDPLYTISCNAYGGSGCNATGSQVHVPSGYTTSSGTDHHVSFQTTTQEVDLWGGDPNNQGKVCNLLTSPNVLNCSGGGNYTSGGKGIANNGNEGEHGGAAFGINYISVGDLLNGYIGHAMGMNLECADDAGGNSSGANPGYEIYPGDTSQHSDAPCLDGEFNGYMHHDAHLFPSPAYGEMVYLKMTPAQITATGASHYCQVVLNAFATFGAYVMDTENSAIQFNIQGSPQYGTSNTSNPWFSTIYPSMVSGGDGSGTGNSFRWHSCLNRIPNVSYIGVFKDPNLGY